VKESRSRASRNVTDNIRHVTAPPNAASHREQLSTTRANTYIFGDNRQARNLRQFGPTFRLPPDEGYHIEVVIPYFEPFLYAGWMIPLNVSTWQRMKELSYMDEEFKVNSLGVLCATTLILSQISHPLPAICFLEARDTHSLTINFYNHHLAAFEGLFLAKILSYAMNWFEVCPEYQILSLWGTFFGTFFLRHTARRLRGIASVSYQIGDLLLFIFIY